MAFWIIIGLLCIAITIIISFSEIKDRHNTRFKTELREFSFIVFGVLGFLILLFSPIQRMEYEKFCDQFALYEAPTEINSSNLLYVMDILEANELLAEYKASYNCLGPLSIYPSSVLDIEPIEIK